MPDEKNLVADRNTRLLFVCLTNILLISSVISLMSLSLTEVCSPCLVKSLALTNSFVDNDSSTRRIPVSVSFLHHWTCHTHAILLLVLTLIRLSVYVLESSTSRRLTYFMPPMVSNDDLLCLVIETDNPCSLRIWFPSSVSDRFACSSLPGL